jgi:phage terminase large subunit-like protein
MPFDQRTADGACNFFENILRHTADLWYGKPFLLTPWQEEAISEIFGHLDDNGNRVIQIGYIECPKKSGKALALDTPIPTPDGWKTMGDLRVGGRVFDEKGEVYSVVCESEVFTDHDCYRLEFSNGEMIIADGGHRWLTSALVPSPDTPHIEVRTTEEIFKTQRAGHACNHSIAMPDPLQLRRKLARMGHSSENEMSPRSRSLQIQSVTKVDPVPVKCIGVDSPSHLFLCGKTMIPTHNTEWAAGLALLVLVLSNQPGCQVYGAAAATRQALNVFRAACKMVEQSPILKKRLRILRGTNRILKRSDPDSFYAAIAADGDMGDGVNPACVIADEVHRWKTRKQLENWDVLSNGGITRRQTLTIAITTAGVQNESPLAWRLHEKTRKVQQGIVTDPTFYGRIYAASPEDDPSDPQVWIKANPSLKENGGFLDIEKIREKYVSHVAEGDLTSFKRYYLNLWDQKESRAIDMAKWDASAGDWRAEGLLPLLPEDKVRALPHAVMAHFIERRCWVGVDLSMSTDLSSVTFVFPCEDGAYDVLPFFWTPEASVRHRELRDGMPYRKWAEDGFLELSPGDVISYRDVRARLEWGAQMFDLQEICFDPWNSREMSVPMVEDGYRCIEVRQGFQSLSEPSKKLLQLVAAGKFHHGAHPVLRWNASCVTSKEHNDNLIFTKPERSKNSSRIDGISASVNALFRAIIDEQNTVSYTGLRSVG